MGRLPRSAHLHLELLEDRRLLAGHVISGYVFNDLNGNGLRDAGETLLANNPIELRNAAGQLVGSTTTDSNGYYSFSTDSSINTGVQSQVQTISFADASANTIRSQSLQQFDPSLGTLQSVEIRVDGRIISNIRLENLDDEAAAVTGSVSGTVLLSGPGFNLNVNITGNAAINQTLAAYDGNTDYLGGSGVTLGNRTATGSNSQTLTGSALSPFLGTGNINLSFLAQANTQASGGGNLMANISNQGGGQVTITYRYLNSTSLKPGNYTLIQKAQPAGLLDGRDSQAGIILANSFNTDTINVTLGNTDSIENNFGEYTPASLSGYVYQDANDNGIREATEKLFANSQITLTGTNDRGQSVSLTALTDASGKYLFSNLRPGQYALAQSKQPTSVGAGKLTAGSLGGTLGATRSIGAITVPVGAAGTDYNFAHLFIAPPSSTGGVGKGQLSVSITPKPPSATPVTPPAPIQIPAAGKGNLLTSPNGSTTTTPAPQVPSATPAPAASSSAGKGSLLTSTGTPRPPSAVTPPAPVQVTTAGKGSLSTTIGTTPRPPSPVVVTPPAPIQVPAAGKGSLSTTIGTNPKPPSAITPLPRFKFRTPARDR